MPSGPSKTTEAVVAFLIPPACREEALGDLHERFQSPSQYVADALFTIPLIILSRIRRPADVEILLLQSFALYMSFAVAAWLYDGAILFEPRGLLRLAIPAAMAMLGLILDDTYAHSGRRTSLELARGPLLGAAIALASEGILWMSRPDLALPRGITLYGCAMSILLSSGVRIYRVRFGANPGSNGRPESQQSRVWQRRKENYMSLKARITIACGVLVCAAAVLWAIGQPLVKFTPFLLVLGVWVVLMIRFPNIFKLPPRS
jgi:hypothetical protein